MLGPVGETRPARYALCVAHHAGELHACKASTFSRSGRANVTRMARRPLTSAGGEARQIRIRVARDDAERLQQVAAQRGVTISDVLRSALATELAAHDDLEVAEAS